MYPHQAERLTAVLEREGLEALVATSPANVRYVTGFRNPTARLHPGSEVFAVFTRGGTALVVPALHAATVAAEGADVDHVRCYGPFPPEALDAAGEEAARLQAWLPSATPTAAEALASTLGALGAASGRLGVDESGLTPGGWRRLEERLGGLALTDAAAGFAAARLVKSPWEVECSQRALHAAEEAVNAVIQRLGPGVSEREAARTLENALVARGAEPAWMIVLMGPRSAIPAAAPSERSLKLGDLVRFDVGAAWKGYLARLGRTAVMGQAAERHQALAEAIRAGLEAAVETMKPGIAARRIVDAAVDATRKAGIPGYGRHRIGHGIGLDPVEPPLLAADSETPLEPGNVLSVETSYYEPGWGGLEFQDMALMGRAGATVLNRSVRGLVVLD